MDVSAPPDPAVLGCAQPWCAIARDGLSHLSHLEGCRLAYAVAMRAGEPLPPTDPIWCAECGIDRGRARGLAWRRGWDGMPLCADCTGALEWDGQLRAFYAHLRQRRGRSWST